jgi:endonuclease-3 related protein
MHPPTPSVSLRLRDLYAGLRGHFGYTHPWWPGTPLEIALTAVLVQQCGWSAAWKGVCRLREEGLAALPALAGADPRRVEECIRGVAFGPTKAGRLIRLARSVLDRGHREVETYLAASRPTAELRRELLAHEGVGEETADCLLLFASEHASFVIDAYTRRALRRLALFPELGEAFWDRPYRTLQGFFETHVLADLSLYDHFEFAPGVPRAVALFRDFHAQLVELGKHHCLKSGPCCRAGGRKGWDGYPPCEAHCRGGECGGCPLVTGCTEGQKAAEVGI